ncbi:MAG: type I-B CRISPR-associated protein Cas7/Cst2/DevR [Lewinellaceae bacterium]|nr:type I-B CRISPR-associated protein Cas7/Cst2/DevR [Lewinellaceae bacterium]
MSIKEKKTPNCLNVAYIFKTSLGSINGSWTEGNVSTVKKITLPNGNQLPYVSGQSLKYQIRKAWVEMGLKDQLSEVQQSETTAGVNFTAGDPSKYLDDDLLGYMIASTGENRRRTAPVRVSAAIGVFPFRNDRDLGTKSKEQVGGDVSAGGNIFETEIYYNYFKVNFLIELDRIGSFQDFELNIKAKGKTQNLSVEEKRKRLNNLLNAISNIWGGGKQSRILTDMSPKFLAITFQYAKTPIFLETLTVDELENLNTKAINEVLSDNQSIIEHQILGVQFGIFKNSVSDEIKDTVSIQTAFENALTYISTLKF